MSRSVSSMFVDIAAAVAATSTESPDRCMTNGAIDDDDDDDDNGGVTVLALVVAAAGQ